MSRAFPGAATDYAKEQRRRIAERLEQSLCPSCGGKYWANGKRFFHRSGCPAWKSSAPLAGTTGGGTGRRRERPASGTPEQVTAPEWPGLGAGRTAVNGTDDSRRQTRPPAPPAEDYPDAEQERDAAALRKLSAPVYPEEISPEAYSAWEIGKEWDEREDWSWLPS